MRLLVLPLLSASLLLIKGCDLNDMAGKRPEQIQQAAEQQLSPYFPKAKVIVTEDQRTILGMTCVSNVGKPFLEQMIPVLEKSEGVKQLREYRTNYAGFEGISRMLGMKLVTYRYFSLGFDRYVIRLDADTQQHTVIPAEQVPNYSEAYAQKCSAPEPTAANTSPPASTSATAQQAAATSNNADGPETLYVWIGTFIAVTHKAGESADEQSTIRETLGLHTTEDFASRRAEEVIAREQMIRHMLEQKQLEVKALGLRQIERAPVPQNLQAVDLKTGVERPSTTLRAHFVQ